MNQETIFSKSDQIKQVAQEADLSYLALFGSHARGDAKPDSDIDLLFDYQTIPDFFKILETEDKLSKLLGKKVDLVSKCSVSKYLRPYIKPDLKVIYEQT